MLIFTSFGGAGTVTGSKHLLEHNGRRILVDCGAGHILGASTVDIEWAGRRIVPSGDLGRYDDPVMVDPESVAAADCVVVESTYGNRPHDRSDPTEMLGQVVGGFQRSPGASFIVHGEATASEALRVRIGRDLGWEAVVPVQGQVFEL